MIKFVVARHLEDDDPVIEKYLNSSIDRENDAIIEIWKGNSIFEKYNTGIKGWIDDPDLPLQDDDIICFMHEDILIRTPEFKERVEFVFEKRKEVGVLGVIGTKQFSSLGGWWLTDPSFLHGSIYQSLPSGSYKMIKKEGYTEEAVSVDGCCFFVRGNVAKEIKFDDTTYFGYHFYDCDYCFSVLESGYNIAISDIAIEHKSPGPMDDSWLENRDKFLFKWVEKGLTFPVKAKDIKNLKN